jgi:hypothetical protein
MKPTDHKFYDGLLQILSEAPKTQIDENIVIDIKKFISEEHTIDEKHNFIQNISKEPLNMISDQIGVGRISKFIKEVCDLNALLNYGETLDKVLIPEEKVIMPVPKEGEHIAYGWDGKPFIAQNESDKSKITIEYLIANQGEDKEERVLVEIFSYMEDLMWEGKFKIVDDFIYEFCKHDDICFQYYLTLLTCAYWAKDKLKNIEGLRFKAREIGNKEIGEKDTNSCLKGLI